MKERDMNKEQGKNKARRRKTYKGKDLQRDKRYKESEKELQIEQIDKRYKTKTDRKKEINTENRRYKETVERGLEKKRY